MYYYDCCGSGGTYGGGVLGRRGAQGIPGPAGPQGEAGEVVTSSSGYAANTSNANIDVISSGTNIPLPDYQALPPTITVDGTNEIFTVQSNGRYYISYQINTVAALLPSSRITVNSTELPPSVYSPAVSTNRFSSNLIYPLNAGDALTLQLFGIDVPSIDLGSGVGASMTIIRLE